MTITIEQVRESVPDFLAPIVVATERQRLIDEMKSRYDDWDGDTNIHDPLRAALELTAQTRFLNVEGMNARALQLFTAFAEGENLVAKIEGDYGVEKMGGETDEEYRIRGPKVYAGRGSSDLAEITLEAAALSVEGVQDAYVQVLTNTNNARVYVLQRYSIEPAMGARRGDPTTARLASVQENLEPEPIGSTLTATAPANVPFTIAATLNYVAAPTLTDDSVEAASREKLYDYLDEIFRLNTPVRVSQLVAALDTDFTSHVAVTSPSNDLVAPTPSPTQAPTIYSINRDETDIVLTVTAV